MIARTLVVMFIASTSVVACGDKGGCSKDTDCKADRICVRGECRDADSAGSAKPTATADPAKRADMERWADELCACKDSECVHSVNERWEGKMNGKLKDMSDKDQEAFGRAMNCALKYMDK